MSNKVNIRVGAKDETKGAFASIKKGFAGIRSAASGAGAAVSAIAAKAKIAIGAMAAGAALAVREFIKFESAARPFARFVGGIEEANQHMRELQAIGRQGVIPTDELVEASRSMMQFSDGVLGGAEDMKALADVAATTGNNVGQVASGVQRFMQAVAQGRNVQSASRDLERMGVVSLEAREKLRQMQDQGASTEAMFAVLQSEINKFAGGVESDMDTGAAAFGRLRETGRAAMVDIGESIMTKAAPALKGLGDAINDHLDAGIVQDYVDSFVSSFQFMADAIKPIIGGIGRAFKALTEGIADSAARLGGFVGALESGQGIREAWSTSRSAMENDRVVRASMAQERAERVAVARESRQRGESAVASGQFGAGATSDAIAQLMASEEDGERGGGRSGPSGMARRVLDQLRRSGEVEEFSTDGMGGMLGGVRQQAREQLQKDEQRDLMRQSVDIQKQIRDYLKKNLEAA